MARKGYIKMYRQIIDSDVWCDAYKFKLWSYCLMKACHKPQNVLVGNRIVRLDKGQFITGRSGIEEEYNRNCKKEDYITGVTLFRWLKLFEKMDMISIDSTNKYSVITVSNWDKYQNK